MAMTGIDSDSDSHAGKVGEIDTSTSYAGAFPMFLITKSAADAFPKLPSM